MPDTGADLKDVVRTHRDRLEKHERDIADNRHGLANHIQVTDIKFANLRQHIDDKLSETNKGVEELKSILKWAGGLIVSLMLSFMAWALLQQYNANESQKRDLQQQMQILQEQKRASAERGTLQAGQDAILQSSGTQPTVTTSGR